MNESPSQAVKQQPKILSVLEYQSDLDYQIESKIKDLYEINSRLDNIANRLNSTEYPKNNIAPKATNGAGIDPGLAPAPTSPDGLVGVIVDINQRGSKRIGELQSVISEIFIGLNYLETHI